MGNCSAAGQCIAPDSSGTPECNLIEVVCGCGTNQSTGCGFPNGYASGPALSGGDCFDAEPPPGPEAGTPVGPCAANGDCPSGSSCYFLIGSCSAKGECIEDPAPGTGTCKSIETLCGCDGTSVTTGCGYPSGYASGPSAGAPFCALDAGTAPTDAGVIGFDSSAD